VTAGCPLAVIGIARTARLSPETTPVQSSLNRDEEAVVEVHEQYVAGLEGLAGFDFAWLLAWLGTDDSDDTDDSADSADPPLRQVPFLLRPEGREMGVFATRGPRRVNPVGLSLVRLLGVDGGRVRFAGVDLVDGTPIIDIKPYVAQFDRPPGEVRSGWFDTVSLRPEVTPGDLAPPPSRA
jgi:tRNA (adenine37-N6)-methyltransferase